VRGSLRVARIGDIDIGVHYSWLLVFLLVAWTLAEGVFPQQLPDLATRTYWIMGVVSSLLLFVSVLVHELAHSLVAESRGLRVRDITIFVFGGVSNIREEPRSAADELVIAAVGPIASLGLAAVFWAISQTTALPDPANGVVGYLAGVNLILGVFNLIPGFPLDGGRVFRALVWGGSHDMATATRIAVGVGRGVSLLFVLAGLLFVVVFGAFISGIWLVFIGWFLNNAAEANGQQAEAMEKFRDVTVRRLMQPDPPAADPGANLGDLIWSHLLETGQRAVPVVEGGRLAGMLTLKEIRAVPQDRWQGTPVRDVMTRADDLQPIGPDDSAAAALRLMNAAEADVLPVVDEGILVGILRREDLARYLQIRRDLGVPAQDVGEHDRAA
jgi:Zn-dependent protease/CBS domain-containing protein